MSDDPWKSLMGDEWKRRERARQIEHARAARRASGSITGGPSAVPPSRPPPPLPSVWEMDQANWPLPAHRRTFLGSAILRLGRTLHENERWDGSDAREREAAAEIIARACADDALTVTAMFKEGLNGPRPFPSHLWQTQWKALAEACAADLPEENSWRDGGPAWLFVDGEQLDQLLEKAAEKPAWWPKPAEQKTAWVNGKRWVGEVRQRLATRGAALSNRSAGEELAAMWSSAHGGETASGPSFTKMLNDLGAW